jgi:transposase InsO family protein
MRVLFCEFDGVLHPRSARCVRFDEVPTRLFEWLDVLQALLAPHDDVFLVVHSDWRHEWSDSELAAALPGLECRLLDSAPRGPKDSAIAQWLSRNPSVTSHLILDDDAKAFPDPQPPELVLCHPETGIYDWRVRQQLREWLHSPQLFRKPRTTTSPSTHPETPA